MLDTTTFVGLDVHARSIKAVSLDVMTGEVRCATFGYDAGAVAEWVRSADPKARCVYESGVTGFDLQKRLSGLGVDCVVGAVSKMIKPSADRRRKNDRNDAEFLARMLSVGNVVEVWVPDDECEAARDLTRALEDARDDLSRAKQRLSKFLLRHGLAFDERTPTGRRKDNWTRAHWSWIESIRFAERADEEVLAYYVDAVRRAAEEKARLWIGYTDMDSSGRGGRRCSRAGSTEPRRTWPRRASSPAGCGRSASWPRSRRGGVPPHISQSPRKRFDPKPLRRTSGPFSASAHGATRVHRLSVRRRSLSRSNGLPSERSPRADNKLRRRASVRHAEVAADGLI